MRLGLEHADIVKIGDEEVQFLTGLSDPIAGARALWHDRLSLMAVTRGAAGCIWLTRDAEGEVPGIQVEAVDTTGAGDAFMAGLLAGVVDIGDAPLEAGALDRICAFANAAGAVTATARGAIPSLPDRETVLAALAGRSRRPSS